MGFVRAFAILSFIFAFALQSKAQIACGELFADETSPYFDLLSQQSEVTESQILKAAQLDILGDRSLSQKTKEALVNFFNIFNMKKDFQKKLMVEIQRRDYKAALESMGTPIKVDSLYILKNNAYYFKLLFSIGANTAVNVASYHYLGVTGILVSIPNTRFFRPDKIPDEVILEMLTKPEGGPATKAFLKTRIKHGVDFTINNIGKYFSIGILSWMAVFHHQMITDPYGYMEQRTLSSATTLLKTTYLLNLETIKGLEVKRANFEQTGQPDKVEKANAQIKNITEQNNKLIKMAQQGQ